MRVGVGSESRTSLRSDLLDGLEPARERAVGQFSVRWGVPTPLSTQSGRFLTPFSVGLGILVAVGEERNHVDVD